MKKRSGTSYFKDLSRKDYVELASRIIKEEGVGAVSIRRMASELGCSSASMYRYFDNLDELLFYAQLDALNEYILDLSIREKEWKDMWDVHFGIWRSYATEAFRNPEAFESVFYQNINRDLGEVILNAYPETRVDVHNPDVLLRVEVRHKINIFSETIPGPGGMPIGTAGRAMLLLSGGIDSPVAGYMVAKRGVTLEATYFHAPPYTSERAKQKVVDLAKLVAKYTGPIKLNVVNFTDIQLYIYDQCPHDELTIIMRRYMMRIAEAIAKESDCLALITGESIGQVASQTLQSLGVTNAVCELPVMRPLIAFDKQDIVDISLKIDTYETSVLPYEDCCTIFVAKHPVTKPNLKRIEMSETKLSEKIDEMVKTAIETREVIRCI